MTVMMTASHRLTTTETGHNGHATRSKIQIGSIDLVSSRRIVLWAYLRLRDVDPLARFLHCPQRRLALLALLRLPSLAHALHELDTRLPCATSE
jgi:hypothetical protein